MERERTISDELAELVKAQGLQPGDRLPPERTLAERLGVSRNTLRGVLRTLAARGLVRIRRSSGTYLRTRFLGAMDNPSVASLEPEQLLADQLEAAFLVFPMVAGQVAQRIGERQLAELQTFNVALSQNLYTVSALKVLSDSLGFFRLIAMGTQNEFLVRCVEQISLADMVAGDVEFFLDREEREDIFADHVKILHALRERNTDDVTWLVQEYVISLCSVLEGKGCIRMTDLVFKAKQQREEA